MPTSITSEFEVAYNKNHKEIRDGVSEKQGQGKCTYLEELYISEWKVDSEHEDLGIISTLAGVKAVGLKKWRVGKEERKAVYLGGLGAREAFAEERKASFNLWNKVPK